MLSMFAFQHGHSDLAAGSAEARNQSEWVARFLGNMEYLSYNLKEANNAQSINFQSVTSASQRARFINSLSA